uniref:6-phosphogluconate dehydrogenase, decarboxylating n=1 Tax=Cacopsylla melanoneura TaxID=428564 RepID=A0A8D9EJR9_9HEMI
MCCKSTLGTILVFILFHFSTCIDTDKELFEKFECSKNNGCAKPLYQGRVITQYNNLPVSTTVQVYAKKGEYILVKTEKGKLLSVISSFVKRTSTTPTKTQNLDTSTNSIQPSQMNVQPGTFDHSTNGPEEYNDGPGIEESEDPDDISIKDEDGNDYISSDLVLSTGGSLNQNVPSSDNFKTNVQNTQSKTQFPDAPNGSKEKMTATSTATYSSQSPTVDLSDHNAVNQGNENSEKPGMSIKENGTSADSAIPGQGIDTNPENPAAWPAPKPIFQSIAAKVGSEPCCDWVGEQGAGHFVKMVHITGCFPSWSLTFHDYSLFSLATTKILEQNDVTLTQSIP